METLYQTSIIIKSLRDYFKPYLDLLTKPSGSKMFLLLLAMITMQFTTSINHLFKWFLSGISNTSLNAYYYLLSETTIPLNMFLQITVRLALSLIPKELEGLPIFLIVDDTLQAKFGTHFECYKNMFDHAKHNGKNFLKGHCFVALTIAVPVLASGNIRYLHVPLGYRLRKDESKLKIAASMIDLAMEILADSPMVILLCDSWYPKGEVIETVMKYKNLELIANVRVDTCIFNLPPKETGKRGRPALKGEQLDIHTDFNFMCVGDYFIAVRTALTNLFEQNPVYITVTTPDTFKNSAYRVFLCTIQPDSLKQQFRGYEKKLSNSLNGQILWLLPLFLYSFRWNIEVMFYEHKKFWSFGLYRLRSKIGIENFVNCLSVSYACMKILPFKNMRFSALAAESPQTCKSLLGDAIRHEIYLWRFGMNSENAINFDSFFNFSTPSGLSSKKKPA